MYIFIPSYFHFPFRIPKQYYRNTNIYIPNLSCPVESSFACDRFLSETKVKLRNWRSTIWFDEVQVALKKRIEHCENLTAEQLNLSSRRVLLAPLTFAFKRGDVELSTLHLTHGKQVRIFFLGLLPLSMRTLGWNSHDETAGCCFFRLVNTTHNLDHLQNLVDFGEVWP